MAPFAVRRGMHSICVLLLLALSSLSSAELVNLNSLAEECIRKAETCGDDEIKRVLNELRQPNQDNIRQTVVLSDRKPNDTKTRNRTEPCIPGENDLFLLFSNPDTRCSASGEKNSSIIFWNPTSNVIKGCSGNIESSACEILIHELKHAYNIQTKALAEVSTYSLECSKKTGEIKIFLEDEEDTTAFANRYRTQCECRKPVCCYGGCSLAGSSHLPECSALQASLSSAIQAADFGCPPERQTTDGQCAPAVLFQVWLDLWSHQYIKSIRCNLTSEQVKSGVQEMNCTHSGGDVSWNPSLDVEFMNDFGQITIQGHGEAAGRSTGGQLSADISINFNATEFNRDGAADFSYAGYITPFLTGPDGQRVFIERSDNWTTTANNTNSYVYYQSDNLPPSGTLEGEQELTLFDWMRGQTFDEYPGVRYLEVRAGQTLLIGTFANVGGRGIGWGGTVQGHLNMTVTLEEDQNPCQ